MAGRRGRESEHSQLPMTRQHREYTSLCCGKGMWAAVCQQMCRSAQGKEACETRASASNTSRGTTLHFQTHT